MLRMNSQNFFCHVFTCVTVDGENVIFIAAEYGICDPLGIDCLVPGLHFCNPSPFRR